MLNAILRFSFSFLTGLFCALFYGFGVSCLVALLPWISPVAPMLIGIALYTGFKDGFNLAERLYDRVLSPWIRRHIQSILPAHKLINNLDNLPPPVPLDLLTQSEIETLKKMPKQALSQTEGCQKKLDEYLAYVTLETCPICLEKVVELKNPVTLSGVTFRPGGEEKKEIEIPFTKTYDKNNLRTWIDQKPIEPTTRVLLTDPKHKIQISSGLPQWIYDFIRSVRRLIDTPSHVTIDQQLRENKEGQLDQKRSNILPEQVRETAVPQQTPTVCPLVPDRRPPESLHTPARLAR